jgi:hypothetical protein
MITPDLTLLTNKFHEARLRLKSTPGLAAAYATIMAQESPFPSGIHTVNLPDPNPIDYHTAKTLPDGVLCSCGKTFPGHRKQRGHALDELRKIIKGLTQSLVSPE